MRMLQNCIWEKAHEWMTEKEEEEEGLNNGNDKKSCKNTMAVIISIQLNEASSDDIK